MLSSEQVILGERPRGRLFQGKGKSLVAFFFFFLIQRCLRGPCQEQGGERALECGLRSVLHTEQCLAGAGSSNEHFKTHQGERLLRGASSLVRQGGSLLSVAASLTLPLLRSCLEAVSRLAYLCYRYKQRYLLL